MIALSDYRTRIESALAYGGGTHEFEDVVASVLKEKMQVWVNNDSIAITEIIVYPRKKTLHCFLAAGKAKDIIEMMPSAAAWGRAYGCTKFTISGRKGWSRVLAKHGWTPILYTLGMDL